MRIFFSREKENNCNLQFVLMDFFDETVITLYKV